MHAQNPVLTRKRWLAGTFGLAVAFAAFSANAGTMAVEIRVEHRVLHVSDQSAERNVQRPAQSYAEQCPEKAPKRDTQKRLKRLLV